MKRMLAILAILAVSAAPLAAQSKASFNSGLKLRGNFHVNRSAVQSLEDVPKQENGYGAGLEIIGNHLGVALYGYTAGRAQEFDSESVALMVVAEANYFLPIQVLRLAPYAGIHSALGTIDREFFDAPYIPRPQDGFNSLGYQVGVRFKPIPIIGLDAQWRRQSGYAHEHQDSSLERTQILIGATLF